MTFTNVGFVADSPAGVGNNSGESYAAFDIHLTRRVALRGCDFVQSSFSFLGTSRQAVIEGCTFRAADDAGGLLLSWGSEFLRVANNVVRDLDNSRPDGWGEGRFFVTQGPWGTNQNVYVGSNRTVNMAARRQAANTNTGEQLLLENGTPDFRGPATAGTPKTVTVPGVSVPFDPVEYLASAIVVSGKGVGQSRRVASIDPATGLVTLQNAWAVVPDATSVIVIGRDSTQIAVVENDIDGKADQVNQVENTASTGVMVWGMSHGVVVADNRITDVRVGVIV